MKKKKEKLSDRELQVLELLIKGSSTKAIAANLRITVRTVETHRSNMNRKLEAHNAAEAIHKAKKLKLI